MPQSLPSTQIQATIGNVSGRSQVAVGTKIVQIGEVSGGSIVNILNEAPPPPRLKPQPISLRPKPFRDLLDRVTETADIVHALQSQESVECIGESGSGKTSLLRNLAHHSQLSVFTAGIVYFQVNQQSADDLLKSLFDAFYTCDFPIKPTETEIRSYLQSVNALVLLDDVDIGPERIRSLINNAPNSTFIVVNKERSLFGDAREVTLKGLPVADAVRLFQRELGRALSAEEEKQAQSLCESLDCMPLPVLRAAHKAREEKRALELMVEEPKKTALRAAEIQSRSEAEQRVLAVLAVFRDAPLAAQHVTAIAGIQSAEHVLEDLERSGLVQSYEQQYTLASDITNESLGDLTPWYKRALAYFVNWAEQHHSNPELIAYSLQAFLLILKWAVSNQSWSEVRGLGHALDEALTLSGKWDMWATALESIQAAAGAQGDLAESAWSLHQLGTRALLLDNASTAKAYLSEALGIREQLNDETGAAVTRHNLDLLLAPPSQSKPESDNDAGAGEPPGSGAFWLKAGAIALVGLAALTALVVWRFKGTSDPINPPKIMDLIVTPSLVPANGQAQLCYEVENADHVLIEPNIGERRPATKECLPVNAGETTTYTLTVFGSNGTTASQKVILNVEPPVPQAEIVRFEVLRGSGPAGLASGPFQLCYDVRNAAHAEIDNEVGAVEVGQNRCRQVKPRQTTTYTLTATGADGRTVTRQATADATRPPAPVVAITEFTVSPQTITSGPVSLCYRTENASGIGIEGVVNHRPVQNGERECIQHQPRVTTTYTLKAFNDFGVTPPTRQATVIVVEPGRSHARISFFRVSPSSIRAGQSVRLCYGVADAKTITISPLRRGFRILDEYCFNDRPRRSITYVLKATGEDGQTERREASVVLRPLSIRLVKIVRFN
jgi:hypothetical protein